MRMSTETVSGSMRPPRPPAEAGLPPMALVIGGSAGSIQVLPALLRALPADYPLCVLLVLHRLEGAGGQLDKFLQSHCGLPLCEVEDKQPLLAGRVYLAPAGYHLLVEATGCASLSIDPRVQYSRPSIDVLFESAAEVYGRRLVGVLLSGANGDGSAGLACIKAAGGRVLVQDPATAQVATMPLRAIQATRVDGVLESQALAHYLARLGRPQDARSADDKD